MIRVVKNENVPSSLIATTSHDGEDVKHQLSEDHNGKCYLCERVLITDFQIEHLDSKADRQDWQNLFLACGHCNQKKGARYDDILNPSKHNIEDIIEQKIDIVSKKAIFSSSSDTRTITLLESIFNGTRKMRRFKEERFFEYVLVKISNFRTVIEHYISEKSPDNRQAVVDTLAIDQEFLGLKYWIIKNNTDLATEFAEDIVWNKQ